MIRGIGMFRNALSAAVVTASLAGCVTLFPTDSTVPAVTVPGAGGDFSNFQSLTNSAACAEPPGDLSAFADYTPFDLPQGFVQSVVAMERPEVSALAGAGGDMFDMLALNATGEEPGRYLYRTHEVGARAAVTVTDLRTGRTELITQDASYRNLDGIAWTPWGTLLFVEERAGGRVHELVPSTGEITVRPMIGLRAHEGIEIDSQGNVYGIHEDPRGSIFKFVPDRWGDLSSGKLFALNVSSGTRTGGARWTELAIGPGTSHGFDSQAAANAVGATTWNRPEDLDIYRPGGDAADVLFVAITAEHRVLRITLLGDSAVVGNFVERGVSAPASFEFPDNVAIDPFGMVYIAEDMSPGDIWVATGGRGELSQAEVVARFASLSDCAAEPSGLLFDDSGKTLYVNVQHAGGPLRNDLTIAITRQALPASGE